MTANERIRLLIHHRLSARAALMRTLASLAAQDIGPGRIDVVLASAVPHAPSAQDSEFLCNALGLNSIRVLNATGMTPGMAMNAAARDADQGVLALVPEGALLSPKFLGSCLAALEQDHAQAAYAAHTAGSPCGSPLVRLRPFHPEQLSRTNPVGPAALVRREAWERLGGLRSGLRLAQWDFWLRLVLSGSGIAHVQRLQAFCPPTRRMPADLDGHSKALLVAETPGAFGPDVCRWALALLRGDPWASPFRPGIIPTSSEVRAMFTETARQAPSPWNALGLCGA